MRTPRLLVVLVVLMGVAGCASVPETSPVQVIRQIGGADNAPLPPGPAEGSNPLDLVRDFVFASGSSTERHGAARRFLSPEAQGWNDVAALTVLTGQFDTVPAPGAESPATGRTTIRIRGAALGRVTAAGAFEPQQGTFQQDVTVTRQSGQWRIAELPAGVVVPLSVFRDNYKPVRVWFVDPVRRLAVPDQRHIPTVPTRAQASRVMDLLLAGPSGALAGAGTSLLPAGAQLRSNLTTSADGALVVDLTRLGDLDPRSRILLAAQVVLSLAEVNIGRVHLLVDGEPLVPDRPDLTREDVAYLSVATQSAEEVPGLVVAGGRVRQLTGPEPSAPLPGQAGDGTYDMESAATTIDGRRLAAVARSEGRRTLVVGTPGAELSRLALSGATMTRPSFTPSGSEVWTVLDAQTVARVALDDAGGVPRIEEVGDGELTVFGPIDDLRLSPDGVRVLAVVGGGLYTGAVVRSVDGEVDIRNVRRLRSDELGHVVAADWRSGDTVVAITMGGEMLVAQVSVDGLVMQSIVGNNLTPPLTAIAATANRPLWVTDQTGVWSWGGGDQAAWRQVLGGAPDAIPLYPG